MKYTRDGAFTVNKEGYLVTKDGDYVLNATGAMNGDPGQNNYIRLDPNAAITVNKLGYVMQNNQIVGTIGMVDVDNYDYLEKYGENLYNLLPGGNRIATDANIEQGTLETSNVNVVNEMVNMITIQRAYEAGQKVITSIDGTLDRAVNNVGNRTRIKVVKNKVAPPFKEAEFDIMFGEGISKEGDILDLASELGIVNKSGAWYAYNGDKIGQGRENAKTYLKENPQVCQEIEEKVRAHYAVDKSEEETETPAANGPEVLDAE